MGTLRTAVSTSTVNRMVDQAVAASSRVRRSPGAQDPRFITVAEFSDRPIS